MYGMNTNLSYIAIYTIYEYKNKNMKTDPLFRYARLRLGVQLYNCTLYSSPPCKYTKNHRDDDTCYDINSLLQVTCT